MPAAFASSTNTGGGSAAGLLPATIVETPTRPRTTAMTAPIATSVRGRLRLAILTSSRNGRDTLVAVPVLCDLHGPSAIGVGCRQRPGGEPFDHAVDRA